jgi:hypothetical protein
MKAVMLMFDTLTRNPSPLMGAMPSPQLYPAGP